MTAERAGDCLFCAVAAGEGPAKLLHEDELALAIDVPAEHPEKRGPVHFVVVPRPTSGTRWR